MKVKGIKSGKLHTFSITPCLLLSRYKNADNWKDMSIELHWLRWGVGVRLNF